MFSLCWWTPLIHCTKKISKEKGLWTYMAMCIPYTWQHDRRFSLGTTYQFFHVLDTGAPNTSNVNILAGMELFQSDRSTPPLNCQTTEIIQSKRLELTQKSLMLGERKGWEIWCQPEVEPVSQKDVIHLSQLVRALFSRAQKMMVNTNDLDWVCLTTENSCLSQGNPHVWTWEGGMGVWKGGRGCHWIFMSFSLK